MKNWIYYLPSFIVLAVAAILLLSGKVYAFESPVFPLCTDVSELQLLGADQGALGDGITRGPGNIFYAVPGTGVIQCYCDQEGLGTQTNWWKISELSQEQLAYFAQDGWVYIQNGKDAGLDEGPYLARSSQFECKDCAPLTTPTPEATPSATPTTTPTPTPDPGQTQSSSSSNDSQPQAQPAVTELAPTGNATSIAISLIGGLLSVSGGFLLKKTLE